MAQKFLTPITLLNSSSDPGSAEKGDIYFNTTLNAPKVYTGLSWVPVSSGGASVSDTAPTSPAVGSIWFNSTNGQTYVYYDGFWVEISTSLIGPEGPAGAPGATGPAGPNVNATPTTIGSIQGVVGGNSSTANNAIGYNALKNLTNAAEFNVALGYDAGGGITDGDSNIAIGNATLAHCLNGSRNTALGSRALYTHTTGAATFSVVSPGSGYADGTFSYVLQYLSGTSPTYLPQATVTISSGQVQSVVSVTSGVNVGLDTIFGLPTYLTGTGATIKVASTTYSEQNTAIGADALYSAETTSANTAIGPTALRYLTSGDSNIAIGPASAEADSSGYSFTSGSNNIVLGVSARPSANGVSDEITLGNTSASRFRIPGLGVDINSNVANLGKPLVEKTTVSGTSLSGGVTYDLLTNGSSTLYTSTMGNWGVYLRGSSTVTINSILSVGQALTFVVLATNTLTGYYHTSLYVDNTLRTVKWQGGSAPSTGNTNSVDAYTFTLIKTAADTYTILGSQTKFA